MFWLSAISYCGLQVCNVLSGHLTTIGREGYKQMDAFDHTVIGVNICIAIFGSIKALTNKDFHTALNGNDKAGIENATKPL